MIAVPPLQSLEKDVCGDKDGEGGSGEFGNTGTPGVVAVS